MLQRTPWFVPAALFAGTHSLAHAQQTELLAAALSGRPAPGTGAFFQSFESPAAALGGRVAFNALLFGGDVTGANASGIWFGTAEDARLWLRAGDLAPGTPDLAFDALDGNDVPLVNDGPFLVIEAFAGAPGNSRFGIWRLAAPRQATPIVITSQGAPGIQDALFDNFTTPVMNDSGQVFFYANLQEGPGGVVFDTKGTLWSGDENRLTLVARWSREAPGTNGGLFARFTPAYWSINASGATATHARLIQGPGGVNDLDDYGVWGSNEAGGELGAYELIAREGGPAPGTTGVFQSFAQSPQLNSQGDVLLSANLRAGVGGVTTSNDGVLYLYRPPTASRPAEWTLVLREGQLAPGTTGVINNINAEHAINDAGRILVRVQLRQAIGGVTPENDDAILAGPIGGLELIVREGNVLPLPIGTLIDGFLGVHLNACGTVCYLSNYQNGVSGGTGIFLERQGQQEPETILLTRRPFTIPGTGETREARFIRFHTFPTSNGSDGRRTPLANDDTIAFGVIFTDGSEAMLVGTSSQPCPADFNRDGQVDFFDYLDFANAFGTEDPSADFNRDGQIDFFDYLDFANAFGTGC